MLKTYDFTCTIILSLAFFLFAPGSSSARQAANGEEPSVSFSLTAAETAPPDSLKEFRMVQYSKVSIEKKDVPLLSGYGIYTDLCGAGMAAFSKWGQYEVGAHVGIKRKYFPAVEIGLGSSNTKDVRSEIHYSTHAPYFRIGLDYNLNKNLASRNRYFVGVRYGFSSFAYDLSGPGIKDNYWGGTFPFELQDVKSSAHWGEILFGIQTQLWQFIHLGWTIRYKARLHEKLGESGHAYYIPGYGKGGESSGTFGGSFNLIFEL